MKTILVVAVVLTLAGCATSYQSKGLMGDGYSETQIAPDVFRVSFGGNGYTSGERAQYFTWLRAAELTLQHGFQYFVIVDEKNATKISTSTLPGFNFTSAKFNWGQYKSSSVYLPPTSYNTERPNSFLLIKCFTDKPALDNVWDADFLQQSLMQKYRIEQTTTRQAKNASDERQYQAITKSSFNNNLVKEKAVMVKSNAEISTANNRQSQNNNHSASASTGESGLAQSSGHDPVE